MLRLFGYGPRNRRRPLEKKPRTNLLLGVLAALLLLLPLSYLVNLESKQAQTVVESHRFVPKDASAAVEPPAKPAAKRAPAPKPKKPQLKLKEGKLKRGESIIVALKKSGATSREAHSVSKAAAGLLDMRCLKPGTLYRLYLDPGGELKRFECMPRANEKLIVKKDDEGFSGRWVVTPLESKVYVLKGRLKSSIIEDIANLGESTALAMRYVDEMAWSVDFFRDPRKGDTFGIVYEKRFLDGKFVEYGQIMAVFYEGRMVKQEGYHYKPVRGKEGFYDLKGRSLKKAFLKAPLKFSRISSRYSRRRLHPILKVYRPHLAVDYAAPTGTPVNAVGDGVVIHKGRKNGYGKLVVLRHAAGYRTYYGHLSRYARIRVGRKVSQGQVIGYVGQTGLATGPHLDYRVQRWKKFLNPLRLKIPQGPPLPAKSMSGFKAAVARLRTGMMEAALGARELDAQSVAAILATASES